MVYYKDYNVGSLALLKLTDKVKEVKQEDGTIKKYSNITFGFDTETTSYFITPENKIIVFDKTKDNDYYLNCKKGSVVYIWMFGIEDTVIYGRTLKELKEFLEMLHAVLQDVTPIIYVHNLGFDFETALLNALGDMVEVFARKSHKVMKCNFLDLNLEFRCSYFLTNRKLEKVAEDNNYPVKKLVGNLDYNVLRTPLTELTEEELAYCSNDISIIYYLITEEKARFKHVYNIPLTQTGKVRKQITQIFFKNEDHHKLVRLVNPDTAEEYGLLNRVYAGGYTHANYLHSGKILDNVFSFDITSSYPSVLCIEKYPITKFIETHIPLNKINTEKYAFIVDFTVKGLKSTTSNRFLSVNKAKGKEKDKEKEKGTKKAKEKGKAKDICIKNPKKDNGRLISADLARYELTDQDFYTFLETYEFEGININHIYTAKKDYLPKEFIEYILKLFNDKTIYKDVEGKESLYKTAKEAINCLYGLCVTALFTDPLEFRNGEWLGSKELGKWKEEQITEKLQELKKHKGQNNLYSTGVWCSAYARRHLFKVMLKIGDNVVYCDTDSIKFIGKDNYKYFAEDNKEVQQKIIQVCLHYDLDPNKFVATTPKGKVCKLGYFDEEQPYTQFITLGAKKYAYIQPNKKGVEELHITVSGINKKYGVKALKSLEDFKVGKFFDYDFTGKQEVYYLDDMDPVTFEDGWTETSKHGVCLKPTTYLLGITEDYADIIDYNFCNNSFDFNTIY